MKIPWPNSESHKSLVVYPIDSYFMGKNVVLNIETSMFTGKDL
jgi:hypothetical protein